MSQSARRRSPNADGFAQPRATECMDPSSAIAPVTPIRDSGVKIVMFNLSSMQISATDHPGRLQHRCPLLFTTTCRAAQAVGKRTSVQVPDRWACASAAGAVRHRRLSPRSRSRLPAAARRICRAPAFRAARAGHDCWCAGARGRRSCRGPEWPRLRGGGSPCAGQAVPSPTGSRRARLCRRTCRSDGVFHGKVSIPTRSGCTPRWNCPTAAPEAPLQRLVAGC